MPKVLKSLKDFSKIDISGFPDFYNYKTPLERGLWVLWVVKEKLKIRKLTAEQITSIIIGEMEVSIDAKSIINSFNRAKEKIHAHHEGDEFYFEIMKAGKDFLVSRVKEGSIEILYFEPEKRFTSKKVLSKNILGNLQGEVKIVDPYCSERTLDILKDIKSNISVKFLTRTENLREKERKRFLRELKDFKTEKKNIKFKNYPRADIHDRYIISPQFLIILGHSIKDLGSKESFAVVLDRNTSRNIFSDLVGNFNRKWSDSSDI